MKTFTQSLRDIRRDWYIVDATGKILGRLASVISHILRGKHKTNYVPYLDIGDYVIVVNAKNICVTGNKYKNKLYYRHTGYPGGIKKMTFDKMINIFPERVIEIAVKRMLPNGPLGRVMYRKLKVYSGNNHVHKAQKPSVLKFN